jgi:hypothetical protein
MNHNDLYLIHEEDYLTHIDDKLSLYLMLNQLTGMIARLPANRGSKQLAETAAHIHGMAEELFACWDIPRRYLLTGDVDDLALLMSKELAAPEDAADCFYCEDCGPCPYDAEESEDEPLPAASSEEDDKSAQLLDALATVIHCLYGDDVQVH